MYRTNSPGQYLVVDQNLSQRFPVNNSKVFPFFVGAPNQPQTASHNLPTNSLYTNQLNSSLNGNVGLNTQPPPQQDKLKSGYHPSQLNSPYPNHHSGVNLFIYLFFF